MVAILSWSQSVTELVIEKENILFWNGKFGIQQQYTLKCRLQNGGHIVLVSKCYETLILKENILFWNTKFGI